MATENFDQLLRGALHDAIHNALLRRDGVLPLRRRDPQREAIEDRLLELHESASLRAELRLCRERGAA